ncbi:hypothetical protein U1Q18_048019, partial [Sarracenia purpurea var. burkii]
LTMAGKPDDALVGRGRGRGRGHGRRSPSRTTNPSTSFQATVRRRVNVSKKKSTIAVKA